MKKKFIWLIVSCLMVVTLVLVSCKGPAEKGETGGTLTIAQEYTMPTFEIFSGLWTQDNAKGFTHNNLVEGNWYIDRDICNFRISHLGIQKAWTGALAESWETPDPLTIVFHIRKGIKWQNKEPMNGREFVAEDAEWNFVNFMASPKYKGHALQQFVKSVTATDNYTLVFKLTEVYSPIMMHLAPYIFMSAPEIEDSTDWRYFNGTGPFSLEEYLPDSSLTFNRNPDYFKKDEEGRSIPYVDSVKMLIIVDATTRIAALRTGKIDLWPPSLGVAVSWDEKASIEKTNPEVQWAESMAASSYDLILKNTIEPFNDVRVRKALNMAIDRQAIVDAVLGGNGVAFAWPTRPDWPWYVPLDELPEDTKEIYTYNPEKARQLLADAGYPDGFETTVQCNFRGWEAYADVVELVADWWDDIGVKLEIKRMDDYAVFAVLRLDPWPFDHILGMSQQQDPGVFRMLEYRYSCAGPWNRARVCDPVIEETIDKASKTFDPAEQEELFRKCFQHMTEQAYVVSFPKPFSYAAWWPWVKGYQGEGGISYGSFGGLCSYLRLDLDLKEEMIGR